MLRRAVHPRMRGERSCNPICCGGVSGSSPHARGTQAHRRRYTGILRFIPACAGNADCRHAAQPPGSVHPRMRGERVAYLHGARQDCGSSPHARGTRPASHCCPVQDRFIPACAGNARRGTPRHTGAPVHPRMRGERPVNKLRNMFGVGSSPHARGTHGLHDHHVLIHAVHPRMRGERANCGSSVCVFSGSSPHARGTRERWEDRHRI